MTKPEVGKTYKHIRYNDGVVYTIVHILATGNVVLSRPDFLHEFIVGKKIFESSYVECHVPVFEEYWINVYKDHIGIVRYDSKEKAEIAGWWATFHRGRYIGALKVRIVDGKLEQ